MKVKKFDKKNRVLEVELLPPSAKSGANDSGITDPSKSMTGKKGGSLASRWGEDDGKGVRVTLPNGKTVTL